MFQRIINIIYRYDWYVYKKTSMLPVQAFTNPHVFGKSIITVRKAVPQEVYDITTFTTCSAFCLAQFWLDWGFKLFPFLTRCGDEEGKIPNKFSYPNVSIYKQLS